MRVALLGPYPIDGKGFTGGVDAVIAALADGLSALGTLDLHVVAGLPSVKQEHVVYREGMTVHYLPQSGRLSALTLSRENVGRLRAKLDSLRPDVVHAQGTNFYAGAAVSAKAPSILTIHGIMRRDEKIRPGFKSRLRALLVGYYERKCVAKASDVICISPYVEREFRWRKGTRVHHLENPIPAKYYAVEEKERPDTILFVGRVIRRKGLLELVEALAQVREVVPGARLRIAGEADAESDYAGMVMEAIVRSGLRESVDMLGLIDENRIVEEYSRCSLVVLPSRQETAPMAVQQAMAAGKAVVATRVGGLEYLVSHGVTGLLVDFGDRTTLAKSIVELLADPERRGAMGRAAKEAAGRFRGERVAGETYRIYQLVADRSQATGKLGGNEWTEN